MSFVIVTQGLPASGKTTKAKEIAASTGMHVLCLDNIREMMTGRVGSAVHDGWRKEQEDAAIKIMLASFRELVSRGEHVIVANCHMTKRLPGLLKNAAHEAGGAYFEALSLVNSVTVEECIERDAQRGLYSVGEAVIRRLHKSNRGWTLTTEWLNDYPEFKPWQPTEGLPWAVVSDLDGTLAIHPEGWSPYDDKRIPHDTLNRSVYDLIVASAVLYQDKTILLTGREDTPECREATQHWLTARGVYYDHLFMRELGDKRSDSIVKNELFDKHVLPNYNVRVIWEDRNRVLATWRRRGIPSHQVNYGNF